MSLSARLYRRDRQPLGTVDQVQESLTHFFPDTRFIKVVGPGSRAEDLNLSWWLRAWLFIFSDEVQYPFWEGRFERDQFAVVFNLGPDPLVQSVRVALYGRATPAATPLFDALTGKTGWRIRYY